MIVMHELDPAKSPAEVLEEGGDRVRNLVEANRILFGGSWLDFAEDVRRRKAGRPYLFKLPFDCDDALVWIHSLHTYEQARRELLVDALDGEKSP